MKKTEIPDFYKNDFYRFSGSTVEVMEPVAVLDELLLPVFTRVQRRPEIPDLRSLKGGAERAECSIHIICLLSCRAVLNTVDTFHFIATKKRCPDSMPRFVENKHTEPREKEF